MAKKQTKKKRIKPGKQSKVRKGGKTSRKKHIESQNKILKNFFIGIGVIIITILLIFLFINQTKNFEYEGVEFSIVKFCDTRPCLITYNTKIPVIYQGEEILYNFYLRNDPRKLVTSVPFDGEVVFKNDMFINITFNRGCEGHETIAIVNFLNLYEISGINVIADENTECDSEGNSMFVLIQESNRTSIEQFGPACYNINIKNCEILEGTERFLIDTFVEIDKLI
jgi:hypothetical protein